WRTGSTWIGACEGGRPSLATNAGRCNARLRRRGRIPPGPGGAPHPPGPRPTSGGRDTRGPFGKERLQGRLVGRTESGAAQRYRRHGGGSRAEPGDQDVPPVAPDQQLLPLSAYQDLSRGPALATQEETPDGRVGRRRVAPGGGKGNQQRGRDGTRIRRPVR